MDSERNVSAGGEALASGFREADTSSYPPFPESGGPMAMGLWVLWVAKDELGAKRLRAEDIASVIRDVLEVSVAAREVTNAFNRAGKRVHRRTEGGNTYYEIMKPGKDHLVAQPGAVSVQVFYFQPGSQYTSKRLLASGILGQLKGDLRVVDPYCGERTLDLIEAVTDRAVRFLTRVANLSPKDASKFRRAVKDFKKQFPQVEFRECVGPDIHDRYVIGSDSVVILGHSMKDLGGKESFAVVLHADANKNLIEDLAAGFDSRWKRANPL